MHRKRTQSKSHKLTVYRRRVKGSRCRGRTGKRCSRRSGCKRASGTKRRFCRKSHNRSA